MTYVLWLANCFCFYITVVSQNGSKAAEGFGKGDSYQNKRKENFNCFRNLELHIKPFKSANREIMQSLTATA